MNKKISLFLIGLLAVTAFRLDVFARVTGNSGSGYETCWGGEGEEACVDGDGNLIPTTDNDTTLGSSSLRWATLYALDLSAGDDLTVSDDMTVTGDALKTMVSTITVTAAGNDPRISAAGSCGGIVRLTGANADVTTVGFTAPISTNEGCILYVVNVGSSGGGLITFVTNATFIAPAPDGTGNATGVHLGTNDAMIIGQIGSAWVVLGTRVVNI